MPYWFVATVTFSTAGVYSANETMENRIEWLWWVISNYRNHLALLIRGNSNILQSERQFGEPDYGELNRMAMMGYFQLFSTEAAFWFFEIETTCI
jgi:hypothetical protein